MNILAIWRIVGIRCKFHLYPAGAGRKLSNEIKKSTDLAIQQIKDNVDRVIQAEEKKIKAGITHETIQSSIELAKKNIIDKLESNPKLHNEFIEKSIKELEKVELWLFHKQQKHTQRD